MELKLPTTRQHAITDYLRQEIDYVERIQAPPPDTDLMEWFLFEFERGIL